MATYFVCRHRGAADWAARRGLDAVLIPHLNPGILQPGDVVIGTLPVHLAAEVCRRGATYRHLSLDPPFEARGRDLTADEMERYGARLDVYYVERRRE